ncbi:MAG TPA: ABC transporter substrate-binding protein [bacterium]|nr:ABC transporter substrate-binding protein [bacterium]
MKSRILALALWFIMMPTLAISMMMGQTNNALAQLSVNRLVVAWGENPNPTAILKEEGWLEQAFGKVPVTWKPMASGHDMITAIASHSIDLACEVGSPPAALSAAQGIPIRIIWINENAAEALAVNPQRIKAFADLPGKKIGTIVGSTMYFSLVAALRANKIALKDVQVLDGPQQDIAAAYKRGDLDGVYLSNPWLTQVQDSGAKILITSDQVAERYHLGTFDSCVGADSWLKTHKDAAMKFVQGMDRATHFLYDQPQPAYAALAKALNISVEQAKIQATLGSHPTAAQQSKAAWLGTPSTVGKSGVTSAMKLTVDFAVELGRLSKAQLAPNWNPAAVGDPTFVNEVAGVR